MEEPRYSEQYWCSAQFPLDSFLKDALITFLCIPHTHHHHHLLSTFQAEGGNGTKVQSIELGRTTQWLVITEHIEQEA